MAINFVENVDGRARICWPGAVLFFGALYLACAVIPAVGFWLWLGEAALVSNSLALGFGLSCLSIGAILGRSLSIPVQKLPVRKV